MALLTLGAQVLLIYSVLLVPQSFLKAHAWLFYLAHYCLFLPFLFTSRDRCAFLFSPSFLIISYVSISFIIGSFAFSRGYVLSPEDLLDFLRWEHVKFSTAYFMLCNILALFAYFLARRRRSGQKACQTGNSLRSYGPHLLIGGILLLLGSVISIGFSSLGGSGNFAGIGRTFGALVIGIALLKAQWRYRFLAYIGILLLLAAAEYMNRRLVIVLAFFFIFIEAAHLRDLRISLRRALLCAGVLALIAILQVTMTIARGVQGFKGSYWQTFSKIDTFVGLDNVISYSLKQTEAPTTFFHSNNAIHYILADNTLLCYGSTIVKAIFIAVPRSIWPEKPRSVVEIYTMRWDAAWRRSGCSTGINVYAEYFWNFHILGMFCVVPFFYIFNRLFFFYLGRLRADNVWPLIYLGVGYSSFLMYGRGHGLHSLAIDVGLAFMIQWVLFNPFVHGVGLEKVRRCLSPGISPSEAHARGD